MLRLFLIERVGDIYSLILFTDNVVATQLKKAELLAGWPKVQKIEITEMFIHSIAAKVDVRCNILSPECFFIGLNCTNIVRADNSRRSLHPRFTFSGLI